MCCYYEESETKKLRRRFGKKKSLRLWKSYITGRCGGLSGPYRGIPLRKPGWVKSDRVGQAPMEDGEDGLGRSLSRGIHVCTDEIPSTGRVSFCRVAVPVTCYLRDLVGAGEDDDAVFMKVFIRKADFEAARHPEKH